MDRWPDVQNQETQYKIRDLDSALRELKRTIQPPWTLVRGSLKVFPDVLEYPVASGHDELAYIDKDKIDSYSSAAKFYNTSLQQFYEMVNATRNLITEIWDQGTKMLGVNYKDESLSSHRLNGAETASEYTGSGDAGTPVLDIVLYKKGNASIRVPITLLASTATIKNTLTAFTDTKYKSKYHFKWIYLAAVPTSITMRFQVNDSVYLETTGITTQFSGQALVAEQWNLVAHNLDEATEVGAITTASSWASEKIILIGAATGSYYIDQSDLREWTLLDYWYYSRYFVATLSATSPDQEFFFNSEEVYSEDSELVGDDEWADVIMYDALLITVNETENQVIYAEIGRRRGIAWDKLQEKYPDMTPLITTQRYRFNNNPGISSGTNG
jgi:hypothetical protein